ncbi:heme-dependent oxidative N-demethylase family protein [Salaquimonas pukyongi]|uniref:heme-dependent oxidative N-demethylase family protein n=1 Tax=Salaquimonas pukyongi TaxID=2712698 RepID=UPI00096BC94D|nr:DUF3445 domain-containing protein [Salaquimonas pukyongi]
MKHTPYDGSHPLFRIGLAPLDLAQWLEVDDQLDAYLDEKARLRERYPGKVFAAESDTQPAQVEVLSLLLDHLSEHHRDTHIISDNEVRAGTHTVFLLEDEPPLQTASKLVQEDLVLMRKGDVGWRLAAASLCFPSSWSLMEKFGKVIADVHAPVPGFAAGTRNAMLIERIFDQLVVEQPVRRMNWSVYSDDELFHDDRTAEHLKKRDFDAGIFLRTEYQTLRKLPQSGDILFTTRIDVDPFEALGNHPERDRICQGFITSLEQLDAAQLAYKGLTESRDRLIGEIRLLAGETSAVL